MVSRLSSAIRFCPSAHLSKMLCKIGRIPDRTLEAESTLVNLVEASNVRKALMEAE